MSEVASVSRLLLPISFEHQGNKRFPGHAGGNVVLKVRRSRTKILASRQYDREGLTCTNFQHQSGRFGGCQWRQTGIVERGSKCARHRCSSGADVVTCATGPAPRDHGDNEETQSMASENEVKADSARRQGNQWRTYADTEFFAEHLKDVASSRDPPGNGLEGEPLMSGKAGRGEYEPRIDRLEHSATVDFRTPHILVRNIIQFWLRFIHGVLNSMRLAWWGDEVRYDPQDQVVRLEGGQNNSGGVVLHAPTESIGKQNVASSVSSDVAGDGTILLGGYAEPNFAERHVVGESFSHLKQPELEAEGHLNEEHPSVHEGGYQGQDDKRDGYRSGEEEDVDDPWWQIRRFWNNPAFVRFRVSISMANLTMAIPTFLARALPLFQEASRFQLFSQWMLPLREISLPLLAPLLFGGGIVFKSVTSNLRFVLPRLGMAVVMLWVLWGFNSILQDSVTYLRDHGAIDRRVSNVLLLGVELTLSAIAVVTSLSSVGVKISSLVMPFFLVAALAGKDVFHNYFAGFFLFAAQPFRPGDTVAVMCNAAAAPPSLAPSSHLYLGSGWMEGICESVDLRYTVLRNGRHRLLVPNSRFVQREFMVVDSSPLVQSSGAKRGPRRSRQSATKGQNGAVREGNQSSSRANTKKGDEGGAGASPTGLILPPSHTTSSQEPSHT